MCSPDVSLTVQIDCAVDLMVAAVAMLHSYVNLGQPQFALSNFAASPVVVIVSLIEHHHVV